MIVSRLNGIEERLDRMERERRHADAITAKGTTVSAWTYNGRSWRIVNHAGPIRLSSFNIYMHIAVMFEPRSRECLLSIRDPDEKLALESIWMDADKRDVQRDVVHAIGADEWESVLQRCSEEYRSDGSETFTCGQVGLCSDILAKERSDRDLEEALYEIVMKQRHPNEMVALGWHGMIIRLRATDDGGSRTWLERTMEILESAVQLMGLDLGPDGEIEIYHAYCTSERGRMKLYRAMLDDRQDDIKSIVSEWSGYERARTMRAMENEHDLLSTYCFLFKD
jgi:hypothetical protein